MIPWADFVEDTYKLEGLRINPIYNFKADMSGLYLILRSHFYQQDQKRYGKYLSIFLENRSKYMREFLEDNNKLEEGLLFEVDLASKETMPKLHSHATIVAKYYEKENIPSTEELVSDIKYFLELQKFLQANYVDDTQISADEWVTALEDDSVIDDKMFSILEIMYHMDDYRATTSQLVEKRQELGFIGEKSYNKTIVDNSKYVKEFLNKKTIFNEDGTENMWMRFFYGSHVKVEKDGQQIKEFQFKLKDELVEALGKINRKDRGNDVIEREGEHIMENEKTYGSFYDYLVRNEFFFEKEAIENYLLSLKVKPFTILTGNSGTGKTKLSQLFARYIAIKDNDLDQEIIEEQIENELDDFVDNTDEIEEEDFVPVKVTTRKSSWQVLTKGKEQNPGWTISNKCFLNYLPVGQIIDNYEIDVDGIKASASLAPVIQLYYKKSNKILKREFKKLNEQEEENKRIASENNVKHKKQFVNLDINVNSIKALMDDNIKSFAGSVFLELPINNTAIEKRQWIPSYELFNYVPFNQSRVNCKIRFKDIYADAHIEIKFKLTYSKNEELTKYLVENQGKKDKVNVTIKGLYWNLDEFTPSWENIEELDGNKTIPLEVEELLSEEEDTQLIEDQNYKNYEVIPVGANWTENRNIVGYYNIINDKYDDTPAYRLIKKSQDSIEPHFLILDEMNLSHVERYFADFLSAIESGEKIPIYSKEEDDLEIPDNLFIIGTVNVDETTYMFSPKVLDRANVIEFETPSAFGYMNNKFKRDPPKGNISYLENPLDVEEIRKKGIDELRDLFANVTVDGESFWEILSNEINEFQKILKESGFDFGFRVINEIVRFMAVAWEYENEPSDFSNWKRYFDACIKQKMLPKLHGSEKIIGETLNKLYKKCLSSNIDKEEMAKYPESYKKLKEMKIVLNKQRYVSFIN